MGTRDFLNQDFLGRLLDFLREKEQFVNLDEIAGNWKQFKGNVLY